MKTNTHTGFNSNSNPARSTRAGTRIVLLVVLAFALGVGGGAFWFQGRIDKATAPLEPSAGQTGGLSPATLAVLAGLKGKVAIHYYAILDPDSATSGDKELASRADRLLAQYEAAANGKLSVTRYTASSDTGPQEASKDGISPFNLDKGDACYLGLAVQANGKKELFPRLAPEWEAALESDLSRAIARVDSAVPAPASPAFTQAPDQAVISEVRRALPNLASLTVEEGSQILREAALKEAQSAVQEMTAAILDAQKRLAQSRVSGSEAEQQEALKQLQGIQSDQAKQLQEIAGRLQAQTEALKLLKAQ